MDGFETKRIDIGRITLNVAQAGQGPPLVLLHGYPQTHLTWAKVAPTLAESYHVIAPDLRGYGESDAPQDDAAHTVYAKRTMAQDIVALLDRLGVDAAHVLGHDRGGRVAYRLALDHPDRVTKLGILEIAATGDFWSDWHAEIAMAAYHWTFLAQPAPLPETLIAANPDFYVDWTLRSWTEHKALDPFPPTSLAAYRAQMQDPRRVAAFCADYRAGATTDRKLDEADKAAARQITCPMRFLAAHGGFPAQAGDPAELWRGWAPHVEASICTSGHFIMEENPTAVLDTFVPFFANKA